MNTTSAVRLARVTKTFGSVRAVDALDLTIEPGEVVAFLGPNGAGKTTTVDMLLGLSRPTSGTVEVFGGDARRAVALGRVAAVMQTGGLLKDFTIRETVELTASLFRPARPVDEVLEQVGLTAKADARGRTLSGGQRRRLDEKLTVLEELFQHGPHQLVVRGPDLDHRRTTQT